MGDGTVARIGPGDVVLAEDLTGQGHITRVVGRPAAVLRDRAALRSVADSFRRTSPRASADQLRYRRHPRGGRSAGPRERGDGAGMQAARLSRRELLGSSRSPTSASSGSASTSRPTSPCSSTGWPTSSWRSSAEAYFHIGDTDLDHFVRRGGGLPVLPGRCGDARGMGPRAVHGPAMSARAVRGLRLEGRRRQRRHREREKLGGSSGARGRSDGPGPCAMCWPASPWPP